MSDKPIFPPGEPPAAAQPATEIDRIKNRLSSLEPETDDMDTSAVDRAYRDGCRYVIGEVRAELQSPVRINSDRVGWEHECQDGDRIVAALGIEGDTRTECGWLRMDKILARIASLHPPASAVQPATDGVSLIAAERQRQQSLEGWTPEHDAAHVHGEMTQAALCYLQAGRAFVTYRWPWEHSWWKPSDDPIRNLVKAGALIAAEIDRLQRASGVKPPASAVSPTLTIAKQFFCHKTGCGVGSGRCNWRDGDEAECDCGLADLLKESSAVSPREEPATFPKMNSAARQAWDAGFEAGKASVPLSPEGQEKKHEEIPSVQTSNDRPESILPSLPQGTLAEQREVKRPKCGGNAIGWRTKEASCGTPLVYEHSARGMDYWRCPACGNPHWWPVVHSEGMGYDRSKP